MNQINLIRDFTHHQQHLIFKESAESFTKSKNSNCHRQACKNCHHVREQIRQFLDYAQLCYCHEDKAQRTPPVKIRTLLVLVSTTSIFSLCFANKTPHGKDSICLALKNGISGLAKNTDSKTNHATNAPIKTAILFSTRANRFTA